MTNTAYSKKTRINLASLTSAELEQIQTRNVG